MTPFLYPVTSPHLKCYNNCFEQGLLFLEYKFKLDLKRAVFAMLYSTGEPQKNGERQ